MSFQILETGYGEIVEKKSRFIGMACCVSDEAEALDVVASVKKQYYDAKHHCYAYILDESRQRSADDGEPQGTAGRPILDVIAGRKMEKTLVVVTRYFGGTLLGTGGLTRAYSQAAKEALDNAVLIERLLAFKSTLELEYDFYGKLENLLSGYDVHITDVQFTDKVSVSFLTNEKDFSAVDKKLTGLSNGALSIADSPQVIYGVHNKKVQLL